MLWEREKANWPGAETSEFVQIGGMRWHVQRRGTGPEMLMLHGTGASTHSFEGLMNELDKHFTLTAIDLPGHGFSSSLAGGSPSLPNVAAAIRLLLNEMEIKPDFLIGHSAGAAIGVELQYQTFIAVSHIFSLNGAFYPFPGFSGQIFPAMAKLLFLNPFVPGVFAATASPERVRRLLDSTGSSLSEKQMEYYCKLFSSPAHVRGTLAMMANWDLSSMQRKISELTIPLHLLVGGNDGTIDPDASLETEEVAQLGKRLVLDGLGHLMHEEAPARVADIILELTSRCDN